MSAVGITGAVVEWSDPTGSGIALRHLTGSLPSEHLYKGTTKYLGITGNEPVAMLSNLVTNLFAGGAVIVCIKGGVALLKTLLGFTKNTAKIGGFSRLVPGGGLVSHEAAGGHTLARHIGKSDADLLARLAAQPNISGASTFTSREIAEESIANALGANAAAISNWLRSGGNQTVIKGASSSAVGRHVARGTTNVIDVSRFRIVLRRDPSMPTGYRIHTAYPAP